MWTTPFRIPSIYDREGTDTFVFASKGICFFANHKLKKTAEPLSGCPRIVQNASWRRSGRMFAENRQNSCTLIGDDNIREGTWMR